MRKREREILLSLFMSLIYSHTEMGAKQYFIGVIKTQERERERELEIELVFVFAYSFGFTLKE